MQFATTLVALCAAVSAITITNPRKFQSCQYSNTINVSPARDNSPRPVQYNNGSITVSANSESMIDVVIS